MSDKILFEIKKSDFDCNDDEHKFLENRVFDNKNSEFNFNKKNKRMTISFNLNKNEILKNVRFSDNNILKQVDSCELCVGNTKIDINHSEFFESYCKLYKINKNYIPLNLFIQGLPYSIEKINLNISFKNKNIDYDNIKIIGDIFVNNNNTVKDFVCFYHQCTGSETLTPKSKYTGFGFFGHLYYFIINTEYKGNIWFEYNEKKIPLTKIDYNIYTICINSKHYGLNSNLIENCNFYYEKVDKKYYINCSTQCKTKIPGNIFNKKHSELTSDE